MQYYEPVSTVKWYICWSSASNFRKDHDWENLIRVALYSARVNTTLEPIVVIDGKESDFSNEISRMGVKVIFHRVSFFNEMSRHYEGHGDNIHVAAGAFLRFDLPLIDSSNETILYTDCDVVFLKNPNFLKDEMPIVFSAATQFSMSDYNDMNSGVMLINLLGMRNIYESLKNFTIENFSIGLDQEIMRAFFGKNYTHLRPELNWKPYWGIRQNIQILHWHGPKPITVKKLLRDKDDCPHSSWVHLFSQNPEGYRTFEGIYSDMLIGAGVAR